ncbi:MAG: c-type cytochrome [Planctomycetota bacterium]|nr:c-type cytochrome [Planctomycetota bacterium]
MGSPESKRWRGPLCGALWVAGWLLALASFGRHGEVAALKAPPTGPAFEPRGNAADVPEGGIEWVQDEAAWRGANPPTFRLLYFRSPREYGCELLERLTFKNAEVLAFFKAHAAARYVALTGDPELARRYGVEEAPSLVILDPQGGFAGSILGYRPPERLLQDLKPVLDEAAARRERAAALEADLKAAHEPQAKIAALDAAAALAWQRRLYEEAAAKLEALLAVEGIEAARSGATLHMRFAQALAELGRMKEAEAQFELAAKADTLGVYGEAVSAARAEALMHGGALAEAAEAWQRFLETYPQAKRRAQAAYDRAFCLAASGRPAEAIPLLKALLDEKDLPPDLGIRARELLYAAAPKDPAIAALLAERAGAQGLADALADGRDLVTKYSCLDCHQRIEDEVKPANTTCVECHVLLRKFEKDPAMHDRLLEKHPHFFRNCSRIRHGLRAPSLFAVGARVRGEWVQAYLENPYDIRPHLEESMVQMNLNPVEAQTLTRYLRALAALAGHEPPAARDAAAGAGYDAPERVAQGRELFAKYKCHACHQFGNVKFGADQGAWNWDEGRAEAPNLRFARERLTYRTASEWIRDPQKVDARTRMPKFELAGDEIKALVAFIFHGDPGTPIQPAPQAAVKLEHAPTWEEVNNAVFQDTCVHCHMSDLDGGAGNIGAYGYRARRLDLSSYAGIRRGSLQPDGTRLDILKPKEAGAPPPILWRVEHRIEENRRDRVPPFQDTLEKLEAPRDGPVKPGMPLGHPALTPEQIALLKAWLDAGAPGPAPRPAP